MDQTGRLPSFVLVLSFLSCGSEGSRAADPTAPEPSRVLLEWSFANDLAGWRPNGEIQGLRHEGGAARFRAVGLDPILDGPGFPPIAATNRQAIELVLSRSSGGRAQIFFTNTDRGSYGGFQEAWSAFVDLPASAGEIRVAVRPFWEALGTVSRLRLDPPEGEMALRAIRILEQKESGPEPLRGIADLRVEKAERGLFAASATARTWGAAFLVPIDGIEAASSPIVEVSYRPRSARIASVVWVSSAVMVLQEAGPRLAVADPGGRETIDLSGHPGWKGRITHLGVRFGERAGDVLRLSGMSAGRGPAGEPHLMLHFLGPLKAVNRSGKPFEVEVRLVNAGGKEHPGGTVRLGAAGGADDAPEISPGEMRLAPLAPGATARIHFSVRGRRPGRFPLVVEAGGEKLLGEVRIDRPLEPGRLETGAGAPPPVPARTAPYEIGAYYFPGWSPDQWTRWKSQVEYPERMSELGFYAEGDPGVADWHIRWAVEHGISFFIYDWYWRSGKVELERGLEEGFLRAPSHGLMKFALLWANHDPFAAHTTEQLLEVTGYWIDRYFRRPEYLRIDGRPAIFFFAPANLTRDLKGPEAVRRAFESMRERSRAAGLGGLWIAACGGWGAGAREAFAREGYDAATGYNYPGAGCEGVLRAPFDAMVEGHAKIWEEGARPGPIPFIPLLTAGWDSRPWHGVSAAARLGRSGPAFAKGLRALKDHLDRTGGRMAILEAWNELGEGSDLEPTVEHGFELLEAVREVFAKGPFPETIVPADLGIRLPALDPDHLGPKPSTWR